MFLGNEDSGTLSVGWAAFRILTDVRKIQEDPEISWIVSQPKLHLWVGPAHSVMTYVVLGSSVLNIVLSHPDDIDNSGWNGDRIRQEIAKQFEDWNPAVKKTRCSHKAESCQLACLCCWHFTTMDVGVWKVHLDRRCVTFNGILYVVWRFHGSGRRRNPGRMCRLCRQTAIQSLHKDL
jgi:hypothetical protein